MIREMNFSEHNVVERATGVEPVSPAWEAGVMPLYDARLLRHSIEDPNDASGS